MTLRLEINGHPATAERLTYPATANYGHFTAMQVRAGRVRGLGLHLDRLSAATRELWDGGHLSTDRVLDHIRHALGDGTRDASVRVIVYWADGDDAPSIMVTVRAPADMPGAPLSLQSVPYQRPVPHIKHLGSFGQFYFGRLAERNGFDDALLTGPGGIVSEGAITNVAFFDGTTVVWPDAPALAGISMQLVEPSLSENGLPTRRGEVRLADLSAFRAVFVTNSRGISAVARIDNHTFPIDTELMKTVTQIYEGVPWDHI